MTKIVDDTRYSDAVRIKTDLLDGRNRLVWVDRNDLDFFLAHPENFRTTIGMFETNDTWRSGGRKKFAGCNGKVWRWQKKAVKVGSLSRLLEYFFSILIAIAFLITVILFFVYAA
jgi:hypothetical protein